MTYLVNLFLLIKMIFLLCTIVFINQNMSIFVRKIMMKYYVSFKMLLLEI